MFKSVVKQVVLFARKEKHWHEPKHIRPSTLQEPQTTVLSSVVKQDNLVIDKVHASKRQNS